MQLTPGLALICQNLHIILAAPSVVYLFSYLIQDFLGHSIPIGAVVCICILFAPASVLLGSIWGYYRNVRDATARGAVLPQLLPSKWPGGLDLAAQVKKAVESRFPGASTEEEGLQISSDALIFQRICSSNSVKFLDIRSTSALWARTGYDRGSAAPLLLC